MLDKDSPEIVKHELYISGRKMKVTKKRSLDEKIRDRGRPRASNRIHDHLSLYLRKEDVEWFHSMRGNVNACLFGRYLFEKLRKLASEGKLFDESTQANIEDSIKSEN